jgi:hypothetical protein
MAALDPTANNWLLTSEAVFDPRAIVAWFVCRDIGYDGSLPGQGRGAPDMVGPRTAAEWDAWYDGLLRALLIWAGATRETGERLRCPLCGEAGTGGQGYAPRALGRHLSGQGEVAYCPITLAVQAFWQARRQVRRNRG